MKNSHRSKLYCVRARLKQMESNETNLNRTNSKHELTHSLTKLSNLASHIHALFPILNHIELTIQRSTTRKWKCVPKSNCSWFIFAVASYWVIFFSTMVFSLFRTWFLWSHSCLHNNKVHFSDCEMPRFVAAAVTRWKIFPFIIPSTFDQTQSNRKTEHFIYLMDVIESVQTLLLKHIYFIYLFNENV